MCLRYEIDWFEITMEQECIPVGCIHPTLPWTEIPLCTKTPPVDRDPHGQRPPVDRDPSVDRDPPREQNHRQV